MPTEKAASPIPKCSADVLSIRPAGSGRDAVRCILASSSASYHWFKAPEAPAPVAMHRIAVKAITGWIEPGAANNPHSAVKTTRDITRGLVSAQKSCQRAGNPMSCVVVVICFPTPDVTVRSQVRALEQGKSMAQGALPSLLPHAACTREESIFGLLDHRQRFELVIRRRAGQRPFEGRCTFTPIIVFRLATSDKRPDHVDEEDQNANAHHGIAI